MACNCETIECINVFLVPCAENVTLTDIVADETATWKMAVYFNGGIQRADVEVTQGQALIVPNVFNENYTHKVEFYRANNDIFNCYSFKIMGTVFTNPPTITTDIQIADVIGLQSELDNLQDQIDDVLDGDHVFDVEISESGNAFADSRMANKTVSTISFNGQDYNSPFFDKELASETLTSTILSFTAGDIVTVTLDH